MFGCLLLVIGRCLYVARLRAFAHAARPVLLGGAVRVGDAAPAPPPLPLGLQEAGAVTERGGSHSTKTKGAATPPEGPRERNVHEMPYPYTEFSRIRRETQRKRSEVTSIHDLSWSRELQQKWATLPTGDPPPLGPPEGLETRTFIGSAQTSTGGMCEQGKQT